MHWLICVKVTERFEHDNIRCLNDSVVCFFSNKKTLIFVSPFQSGASFMDHVCYNCLVLLWFHARLFIDAPCVHLLGKG